MWDLASNAPPSWKVDWDLSADRKFTDRPGTLLRPIVRGSLPRIAQDMANLNGIVHFAFGLTVLPPNLAQRPASGDVKEDDTSIVTLFYTLISRNLLALLLPS
jgi:hypothetical protein